MEAARVCAERGHRVTLLEAADQLGGQVLLAARTDRHSEKLGIVEWLAGELKHVGVTVRLNCFADSDTVRALDPDVVVVATGGLPDTDVVEQGCDLVTSTWDVMSSAVRPGRRVLVFDDHGGEQALTAAERLATGGASVEIATPDRLVGQDVTGTVYPDYLRRLYACGARLTPDHELVAVRRGDGALVATLRNAFTDEPVERRVDAVVVEHGTLPVDDVYADLRGASTNDGVTDPDRLLQNLPQDVTVNPDGGFRLFRIGDAVASRNVHAAMLDARRLCQVI
jgi:pyruvate/2-oxoglutarate dehydrogenase complex dihydrolipoamide dehydrogenase (E3) component